MAIEILFFSNDLSLAKSINAASKHTNDQLLVHPCGTIDRFTELAKKKSFKFILVEESLHSIELENLIEALKKRDADSGAPIAILVSSTITNSEAQKKLRSGYTDIILKPVDLSMLLHKMDIYSPSQKILKENLLFQMDAEGDVEIILTGKFTQVSEYGATVRTDRKFNSGDIVSFFPSALRESGDYQGEYCLARVAASEAGPDLSVFDTTLAFLAPNPKFLAALRLWMRRQFISSTEKRALKNEK
ncbi:MAG: hypothetical protein U1E10_11215 [Bdellovibrionales bacterium]|nr:hypothetical protein [Bdellovibrionales bacterium]